LARFGLDRVWWLVSPGNPLKKDGPASLPKRLQAARAIMDHPKVTITDIEAQLGTVYTAQTLQRLKALYPAQNFIWLMGADNLAQFHLWQDWQSIMETTPVGVLARPGDRISARRSLAAQRYAHRKLPGHASHLLGSLPDPHWCFINIPMDATSSTAIRDSGAWDRKS
jgi:nicotinate-nucleotide adenylyltransferase